ncbi:MAG: sialate O-acetylesterase, partial [Oscillospiraceae bacterium]|nr:sialate O-acetylesterase [Oscillospiraceae bacterium]
MKLNFFRKAMAALCALPLLCAAIPAAAQGEAADMRLLEIYGSDMLFQQNRPARLAGFAPAGTPLRAALYQGDALLASADGQAGADGMFELALPGQPGAYTEYRIEVSGGGQALASLERVVFGELWLSSGQSNMQWSYQFTPEGQAGTPQNPHVRLLDTPLFPEYQGDGQKLPLLAQEDIKGAAWWRGDQLNINGFSAVALNFACALQEALGLPVGMVGASLGGSSIYSWLSREEIDAHPQVKADVEALWRYLPAAGWETHKDPSHMADMTVNYNKRIHPLRHFSPAGVIWYQGESEIIANLQRGLPWDNGNFYRRALTLLQESWAALFSLPELPLVCSNLAGFTYGPPEQPGLFNAMLGELDAARPSLAAAAIYDVPLDWDIAADFDAFPGFENDLIHP